MTLCKLNEIFEKFHISNNIELNTLNIVSTDIKYILGIKKELPPNTYLNSYDIDDIATMSSDISADFDAIILTDDLEMCITHCFEVYNYSSANLVLIYTSDE